MSPGRVGAEARSRPGVWEMAARITLSGLSKPIPLTLGEGAELPDPVWTGKPPHLLVPFENEFGQLSIDVRGGQVPQTERLNGRRLAAKLTNDVLRVRLPFPAAAPIEAVRRPMAELVLSRKKRRVVLPARLRPTKTGAMVATASLSKLEHQPKKGSWTVSVGLDSGKGCHVPAGTIEVLQVGASSATEARPLGVSTRGKRTSARRMVGSLAKKLRGR